MMQEHIETPTKRGENKRESVEQDDGPERRVHTAPRLEDDDPAKKVARDETIKEMVRRVNRQLDEEFDNFVQKDAVVGKMITMAEHPTMAEMAANATTAPAATTAASATATGGAGRTSAEEAADAKTASKAEPPPLAPPPAVATPPSPPPGTSSGSENYSTEVSSQKGIDKFHDGNLRTFGGGDQRVPMAAAPPAPARAASMAMAMAAAAGVCTSVCSNAVCEKNNADHGRKTAASRAG